jgi:hypothetical protein
MSAQLRVSRSDFVGLLKSLTQGKAKSTEAVLWFESGALRVDLGGVTACAPAQGAWRGRARIPGVYLTKALAKSLPAGDPIEIRFGDGRLSVGGFSIPGTWQDIGWEPIELPIDPPLTLLLSLRHNYTEAEIENSGLNEALLQAELKRDAMILKAATVLKPLSVAPADLKALVDNLVRAKYKRRS